MKGSYMLISAAVSRAPETPFELTEAELRAPGASEILVRLVASGLCHTDLVAKRAVSPEAGALLLGHEGAGVVEALGAWVTDVSVGDRVILSFSWCGECQSCRADLPAYCTEFAQLNGLSPSTSVTVGGAPVLGDFFGQSSFATHVITHSRNAVVVPADLDLTLAAPLGCGLQTGAGAIMNVLRPTEDSAVVVYGAGGVGLAAVIAAKLRGAKKIVVVDLVESRLELASQLGATHLVNASTGDTVTAVRTYTAGGATHSLDTTGVPAVIRGALLSLRPRGELVVVGLGSADLTLDVQDLLTHGKVLRGCIEGDANPRDFIPELIRLYQNGDFPLEALVHRYPFERINDAVADSLSGKSVKPVIEFATR